MKPITKLLVLVAAIVGTAGLATAGWAYWSTSGSGNGSASVGTLAAPTDVAVPANAGGTVAVTWTAGVPAPPAALDGYYVERTKQPSGPTTAACGTTLVSPRHLQTGTSCSDTTVPDGSYKYTVTSIFRSWSATSGPSGTVAVVNDAIAPTTTASLSPAANGAGWNNSNVTVTLSAADNPNGSGVASIKYSASGTQTITSTTYSAPFTITAEGTTVVSFFATDTAGNVEATKTQTVNLDKTNPSGSITGPVDSAIVRGNSVTVNSNSADTRSGVRSVQFQAGQGGSFNALGSALTTSPYNVTWNTSGGPYPDGQWNLRVITTDAAGNTFTSSISTVTVDNTAPIVSVTAVTTPSNVNKPSFSGAYGTATGDNTTVTVKVYNGTGTAGTVAATPNATLNTTARTWSTSALNTGLSDGTYTVAVTQTDTAGNAATSTTTFVVDTTGPTASAISTTSGSTAGKPEVNDSVTFTFSELVAPNSLYSGWSASSQPDATNAKITFNDSPGGNGVNQNSDSFTVTGATGTTVNLGTVGGIEGHFVFVNGGSYSFTATLHYAEIGGKSVVTVTLTSLNTGGSAVGTATGSVGYTWTPVSAVTDVAGNPMATTSKAVTSGVPF